MDRRVHARAAESGVVFDEQMGAVLHFREDRICRFESVLSHERALTLFRERA
jgi:hypothetical protein